MKVYIVVGDYGVVLNVYADEATAEFVAKRASRNAELSGRNEQFVVITKEVI